MESKHPLGAGKKGLVMLPFGVKQGGSEVMATIRRVTMVLVCYMGQDKVANRADIFFFERF